MSSSRRFPLASTRVLSIGVDPADLDPSTLGPGVTLASLWRRVDDGRAALDAAGLDVTTCLIGLDPDRAEAEVRIVLAREVFGLVMIGGGIRAIPQNTLVFERIVNVLADQAPPPRFCFNTGPDSTIDAIRRWIS